MRKTVYISQIRAASEWMYKNNNYKYTCPMVFYAGGKWYEDNCYFDNKEEFVKLRKKEGFRIL